MQVIKNLFWKNGIQEGDILYLQRQDRKTMIHLSDGRIIGTYEPLKNVLTELSRDVFESINKGIVINRMYIERDTDGYVIMKDGSGFCRRKKHLRMTSREQEENAEDRIRALLDVLSGQPFRSFLSAGIPDDSEKRISWRNEKGLMESVTFDAGDGCWVTVEFTARDKRIFLPSRLRNDDREKKQDPDSPGREN